MQNARVVPTTRKLRFMNEEHKPLRTDVRVSDILQAVRVGNGSKLLVTGLLCVFGFLTTDSKDKKFLTTLSIVINAVAFMHYTAILKVRDQSGTPTWMQFGGQTSKATDNVGSVELQEPQKLQLQEMAVDVLRHSDWLVTLPFLAFKLYTIFARVGFLVHKEWSILLLVLMVLFGLLTRVGTDELSFDPDETSRETRVLVIGVLSYVAAIVCMIVVLADMIEASEGIPDNAALRSFFLVWCGYPVVGIVAIVARRMYTDNHGKGYSEALSLFKDVGFGALDVYSKAFFALWTAYSCFEQPLAGGIPLSEPYVWNTTAAS